MKIYFITLIIIGTISYVFSPCLPFSTNYSELNGIQKIATVICMTSIALLFLGEIFFIILDTIIRKASFEKFREEHRLDKNQYSIEQVKSMFSLENEFFQNTTWRIQNLGEREYWTVKNIRSLFEYLND